MLISTKFEMHQFVGIVGLKGKKSRIVRITVVGNNVTYTVEYWSDDKITIADQWEDELSEEFDETA